MTTGFPSPAIGFPPWAVVSDKRRAHVERVVALIDSWARTIKVQVSEHERWLRAAWLHDALRDAPAADLAALVPDPSTTGALLHGPAAAERAAQDGETDRGVLDAVRFHSLGYHAWGQVGKALYCADFLEPGRSFDRGPRAALASRYPSDPDAVLREVAEQRLVHVVRAGLPILEPTREFWNVLVA